ncbi:RNA polymerase sigma factor [Paenibacillus sp. JCM 10914]|uniref:RNA polymerase sigma factor n=1 Tax=Paenibacillus sp. JCM 10914 TaxID=1236974 RepID=UPI0022B0AB35|nr:sigma-70 family RNA polymerase sigma factor [Paenibacillus sp. JCM 10914]
MVQAYQRQLYIYTCRMLGSEQDAEDAVQDIFLKAFKSLHGYKPTVSFNAWIYRIAYHHCLNILHKRQSYGRVARLLKRDAQVGSAEEEFLNGVFSESLSLALDSLHGKERGMLILHAFHEKSYAEIGEITGKSPESVRKKLTRIKQKLKNKMSQGQEETTWQTSWIQTKS